MYKQIFQTLIIYSIFVR